VARVAAAAGYDQGPQGNRLSLLSLGAHPH